MKQHNYPNYHGYGSWYGGFQEPVKHKKHLEITTTTVKLGDAKTDRFSTVAEGRSHIKKETIELCQKILCVTRASKSAQQDTFALWLTNELTKCGKVQTDGYGNLFMIIKEANKAVETMFTSHIDTCHKPSDPATQTIYYDAESDLLFKDDTMCMGADDGTGVYLMLTMIRQKIPGLYCFFRDEEIGRVGSRKMADTYKPEAFELIKRCISFDRAGDDDIISSQSPGVCCSKDFVDALSQQLATIDTAGPEYSAAPGSYTDSASFMHLIPECTNLSIGYKNQHGPRETQHVGTFLRVLDSYPKVDWSALPTVRDHTKPEPKLQSVKMGGVTQGATTPTHKLPANVSVEETMEAFLSTIDADLIELMDLVEQNPRLVAYALASDGYTSADIFDMIDKVSSKAVDDFGAHYDFTH